MAAKTKEIKKASTQMIEVDDLQPITVVVAGQSFIGNPREFSSGSKGWNISGKIQIDGRKCQVGCNIIVVGSKPETPPKK